jgi:hypothetical protein
VRGVDIRQANSPRDVDAEHGASLRYLGPSTRKLIRGKSFYGSTFTHVLFAACDKSQSALEAPGRGGLFTSALLKHFKSEGVEDITYDEIIKTIGELKWYYHCRFMHQSL